MKKILFSILGVALMALSVQAQSIGNVTKITASTSSSGTIVLEDTTGNLEYLQVRRGDVVVKVQGATTTARLTVSSKSTGKVIYSGLLTAVYVLSAGGNPTTQTSAQKLTYLKANTY